jgi:hypothetical protein
MMGIFKKIRKTDEWRKVLFIVTVNMLIANEAKTRFKNQGSKNSWGHSQGTGKLSYLLH